MNPDDVHIEILTRVDRQAVKRLYRQAGWWQAGDEGDESWIDAMVRGSFCFAAAYRAGEMIGMGRAISDGASDAYIQDVTVERRHRGAGVGARIVAALRDHLLARGIGWIALVAEPGSEPFYRRLGFEVMPGHTPMKLTRSGG